MGHRRAWMTRAVVMVFAGLALLGLMRAWDVAAASSASASTSPGTSARETPAGDAATSPAAPRLTLEDLGRSYIRTERLYRDPMPRGSQQAQFHRRFDLAARQFFSMRYDQAIESLDELSLEQLTRRDASRRLVLRLLLSLRVELDAVIVAADDAGRAGPRGVVRPLYPQRNSRTQTIDLELVDDARPAQVIATTRVTVPAGSTASWSQAFAFEVEASALPAGQYLLRWRLDDRTHVDIGPWYVVPRDPDAVRQANARRLGAINPPGAVRAAWETARARNDLLTRQPDPMRTASFMTDAAQLQVDLASEIAALERGRDPYVDRTGSYWRVIRAGSVTVPAWVHVPQRRGDAAARPPLVIALHGAGADEAMFMRGYGGGLIQQLADEMGFVVLSPNTNRLFVGDTFTPLVEVMATTHGIDRERVYIVGHSMGSMIVGKWLSEHGREGIAGACMLAGVGVIPTDRAIPPTLVVAAELDYIFSVARMQRLAQVPRAQGQPVQLHLERHAGHVLIVNQSLEMIITWLLRQR